MAQAVQKRTKQRPDPLLVKDQLALLQSMYREFGAEAFTRYMVWILGKRPDNRPNSKTHSRLMPFQYNHTQRDMAQHLGKNNILLKSRQIGGTTWFLMCRLYVPCIINPGTNYLLISQSGEYVAQHFVMLRRAHRFVGAVDPGNEALNDVNRSLHANLLHTSYSNRKELIYDQLDNRIGIASAEVEETGQGLTLSGVVASEVARWPGRPEETLSNLKEAIVMEGTLDIESTPNGAAGYFFEEFTRASNRVSEFTAHFYPWWFHDEYRVELTEKQQVELEEDLRIDEIKLRNTFHLTLQQIAFRREKKKALRHNFDEKYAEDPQNCFLTSGSGFFDNEILRLRLLELALEPTESYSGGALVYFARPVPGRRYVIGADPASGKLIGVDPDYSAAKVVDIDSGEEVAIYEARVPPEDFAQDLMDLGHLFNDALIAVERSTAQESGGEGGTINLTMVNQNYPNIYYHKQYIRDRATGEKKVDHQPGFPTNGTTRVIILNRLKFKMNNFPELIHDRKLINQAMMFVRNEKGKPEAATGQHDDDVLASAIAEGVRMVLLGDWDPLQKRREQYGAVPTDEQQPEDIPT